MSWEWLNFHIIEEFLAGLDVFAVRNEVLGAIEALLDNLKAVASTVILGDGNRAIGR